MRCPEPVAFSAAVIGAGGFGAVHAREWLDHGATALSILNSDLTSSRAAADAIGARSGLRVSPTEDIEALCSTRPSIVSVCTPNARHLDHIRTLRAVGAAIIVEKPFFWDAGWTAEANYAACLAALSTSGHGVAVHHPTRSLARAARRMLGGRRAVKCLTFHYYSGGRYRGEEIGVDLLPHGFSAAYEWIDDWAARPANPQVRVRRDEWRCAFSLAGVPMSFLFRQGPGFTQSRMLIEVDGIPITRTQSAFSDRMEVALQIADAPPAPIANPVSETLGGFLESWRRQPEAPFADDHAPTISIMRALADMMAAPRTA